MVAVFDEMTRVVEVQAGSVASLDASAMVSTMRAIGGLRDAVERCEGRAVAHFVTGESVSANFGVTVGRACRAGGGSKVLERSGRTGVPDDCHTPFVCLAA